MAGFGPAPKPDAERKRTNAPTFGWTDLPAAGRDGPTPALPQPSPWLAERGGWPVATRTAWATVWRKPQAVAWEQDGSTLHGWAQAHARAAIEGPTAALLGEMRQHEDRHGLNPAAMMRLRWRIVQGEAEVPVAEAKKAKPKDRRGRVLRLVGDGGEETTAS